MSEGGLDIPTALAAAALVVSPVNEAQRPPPPIDPTPVVSRVESPMKTDALLLVMDSLYLGPPIQNLADKWNQPAQSNHTPGVMCGPLSADVFNFINNYYGLTDLKLNPSDFWLAGPANKDARLEDLLVGFEKHTYKRGLKNPDFHLDSLNGGDVLYLSSPGNNLGHIVTIVEAKDGSKFVYSNERQPDGTYKIERIPLDTAMKKFWQTGYGRRFIELYSLPLPKYETLNHKL